ncbi:MAG TPA: ATPase, T2SS/T4P/T4SS family [Lacipirellulaceae bacterium]|nr:ATPase, T2SS/T4P/T4SS family [Lacipirellulaceae bacterium]
MDVRHHNENLPTAIQSVMSTIAPTSPRFATEFVSALLQSARKLGASDVHLNPALDAFEARWRLDGVLQPLVQISKDVGPNIIARLKVLSGLLTYDMSSPQEGRIRDYSLNVEVRVSTFPTLYGERAVLRLLGASTDSLGSLTQLGLPSAVLEELDRHLAATSGAVLIVGPAGSGKTTTAYACLRHIVKLSNGGRSIASLEDPIEVAVPEVAQSEVNLPIGFDMPSGLRGLLRLDPEVILIGEMRDRATAEVAMQAALTGQLVVTTFHAGNCDDAVNRLVELGVPDYAVRNAVRLIIAQRLVRRLCSCAQAADIDQFARPFGMDIEKCWIARGCEQCQFTGYHGRSLIAEWRATRHKPAAPVGDEPLWTMAAQLVEAGTTSSQEVFRVLGLRRAS